MDKADALSQLRAAKSAHIRWRTYAQGIISGLPVEKDHVPMMHTDCKFGSWYYGEGQALSPLSAYSAIEVPHEMLHQLYSRIFNLLFGEDHRSALQKLFGSSAKLKQKQKDEAQDLMKNLLAVSATLLDAIELLEGEIKDMPEAELAKLQ